MKHKHKRHRKQHQSQVTKKMWIELSMVAVLLIAIIGGGIYYSSSSGKAVYIGEIPYLAAINLTTEEYFTYTVLPDVQRNQSFSTDLKPRGVSKSYNFTLTPLEDGSYSFIIKDATEAIVAQDVISTEEELLIYLNSENDIPDLEISYLEGELTVKNHHYISAESAIISFFNASDDLYLPVIRLDAEEEINGTINASSLARPPTLSASVDGVKLELIDVEENEDDNYTTKNLTYTAPEESGAYILDITAEVGKETHAYYTLAVGDVIYALKEVGFPEMKILSNGTLTNLTVVFKATTELQPFALPCTPSDSSPGAFFSNPNFARVYSFDGEPQLWTPGAPSSITGLEPFKSYFVKLKEAAETNVTIEDCSLFYLTPLNNPYPLLGGDLTPKTLEPGWHLYSLPGIFPLPLTDFTQEDNFHVFECRQNYNCNEVEINAPLFPGKAYWIYNERPLTLYFRAVGG